MSDSDPLEDLPSRLRWACKECGTSNKLNRRPGPDGPKSLCNLCGMRFLRKQKTGLELLTKPVTPEPDPEPKWICAQCGKGDTGTARHRPGPTGPGTLCNRCGLRYWRSERKERRKEEKEAARRNKPRSPIANQPPFPSSPPLVLLPMPVLYFDPDFIANVWALEGQQLFLQHLVARSMTHSMRPAPV